MKKTDERTYKVARAIAKNYQKAKYNYEVYKRYYLEELLIDSLNDKSIEIPIKDEKKLIDLFEKAVDSIVDYPFEKKLLKDKATKFIKERYLDMSSIEEIADKRHTSAASVYRTIKKGLVIVGENMKLCTSADEDMKGTKLWE